MTAIGDISNSFHAVYYFNLFYYFFFNLSSNPRIFLLQGNSSNQLPSRAALARLHTVRNGGKMVYLLFD